MKKSKRGPLVSCASCDLENDKRICMQEDGSGSRGCPTLTKKEVLEEADKEYDLAEIKEFARNASIQEAECYANRHQRPYTMQPSKTRIGDLRVRHKDGIQASRYSLLCRPGQRGRCG